MIDETLRPKEKAPIHKEANQKMEYRFFGSITLKKGLKLYQFNTETGWLEEVKIKKEAIIGIDGEAHKKMEANYDSRCIYLQALNLKNAKRKVLKLIEQYENQ